MAASIKQMHDRIARLPNSVPARLISCREFHPEAKNYGIHELATTCLIKSACNGIPNGDSWRDGDAVGWNTPVGNYVKKQLKISDFSNWSCWMRTE